MSRQLGQSIVFERVENHWSGIRPAFKEFESGFLEQKYAEFTKTLAPQARERVARDMTDYLFKEFTSIPLITVFHEVAVNPKVIAGWIWPGQGAGRTTHFHLIKAVQ